MYGVVANRKTFAVLAALALALLIAIPRGYMPTAVSDGALLKLCGDGLSPEVMAALLGDGHHHHHHGSDSADAPDQMRSCELAGLSSDALQPTVATLLATLQAQYFTPEPRVLDPRFQPKPRYRPRAPPLS